jgi:histidine decarboxylase
VTTSRTEQSVEVAANGSGRTDPGRVDVHRVLAELAAHLDADRETNIGFPSTLDIDYTSLWPFFNMVLNNVGDPFVPSAYPRNTKHLEQQVLAWFATLLRAPQHWWGVTTTGGTEGIEYGLVHARHRYPDAVMIHSAAAHYSVEKTARKLGLPTLAVRANRAGQVDLRDLHDAVRTHRHRPLIAVASIGTTMTEAVDDIGDIRAVLADCAVTRAWVHADAALSGLPLALLPPGGRPRFDLAEGADSISISAHKFLGAPFPCGIYLTARGGGTGSTVDYIATVDSTIAGSRSGHAPLLIWYAIHTLGLDGLRERATQAWRVAAYAVERLQRAGWAAWRHAHAITVVLDTPPPQIAARWRLASSDGQSHIITVSGVTTEHIDRLISELAPHVPPHALPPPAWPAVTAPRRPTYVDH